MSKYNRNGKVRRDRRWLLNVGDGGKLSQKNENPNDGSKRK